LIPECPEKNQAYLSSPSPFELAEQVYVSALLRDFSEASIIDKNGRFHLFMKRPIYCAYTTGLEKLLL
jgi:hypothetical protein